MKEDFVFLTRISEYEVGIVCQRLREAKINYQIKNSPEEAPWKLYGAASPRFIGKEIWVLISELKRAQELLGLKDKQTLAPVRSRIPLVIRITFFIIVVPFYCIYALVGHLTDLKSLTVTYSRVVTIKLLVLNLEYKYTHFVAE